MFNISLENIGKSPKKLRSLLSLTFLMPVWYSVIFLFHRDFYNNNHFSILICLSYSLTIFASLMLITASIMLSIGMDNLFKVKTKIRILSFNTVFTSCFFQIAILLYSIVSGIKLNNNDEDYWCLSCMYKNVVFVHEMFWSRIYICIIILVFLTTLFRISTYFINKIKK